MEDRNRPKGWASEARTWLDGLPSSVRTAVRQGLRPRVLEDGDAVYVVGDAGDECYFVRSGRIRITHYSRSGKALQTMELRDGDSFGEVSLIDGLPRAENAYSAGRTEIEVLRKTSFEALYDAHPEIARQLNLDLCRRLRSASARAEDASVLTLRERLPRLIVRLAASHGVCAESEGTVISRISQNDLAQMLGVTRQSVSRELKSLERAGLVRLRYRELLIPDPGALVRRDE